MPSPSIALVEEVKPLLQTSRFGRSLRGFDHVTSTNTRAATWAADGAPEGSVVCAELQTAGRGRQGRRWEAASGLNLTFSVVLRPTLPAEATGLVSLAAGVAVAETLDVHAAPLAAALKWPNDVLLEGRKCCGMLLESTFQRDAKTVILGIGLNVNQDAFPRHLGPRATSLRLATGRLVPRAPLLADLLARLETHYDRLAEDGGTAVRSAFLDRMDGLHRPAVLRSVTGGREIAGTIAGITETGALLLDTPAGRRAFHAGEVTTAPASTGGGPAHPAG